MKYYVKFMFVDICKRIDVYKLNKVYISNDESIIYINKNFYNVKYFFLYFVLEYNKCCL